MKTIRKIAIPIILVGLALGRHATASDSGAECQHVATPNEMALCNSAKLAPLVVEVRKAFDQALTVAGTDQTALEAQQRRWLGWSSCAKQPIASLVEAQEACLQFRYRNRLEALKALVEQPHAVRQDKRPCLAFTAFLKSLPAATRAQPAVSDLSFIFAQRKSNQIFSAIESGTGMDVDAAKDLLSQNGIENRGYANPLFPMIVDGGPSPGQFTAHWAHLSRHRLPDLILESGGAPDYCYGFLFFFRNRDGKLFPVSGTSDGYCKSESEDSDRFITFVRYSGDDLMIYAFGDGRAAKYEFFEFSPSGYPQLVCGVRPYTKGAPIDFESDLRPSVP